MSDSVFNNQKISSTGVVSLEDEVWKSVPGFSKYEASSIGRIRRIKSREFMTKGCKAKQHKGHYRVITVANNEGDTFSIGVHRLICLAFHELPKDSDRVKYEPNHKDGNKINNHYLNLEWMTRSQNIQHAFESGLCQVGLRVEAKNIKTGEVKHYNSLSSAARDFNLPRAAMRDTIARHRDYVYDNQWLFVLDESSDRRLKRHQAREIIAKNYLTGDIVIYNNAASASTETGVRGLSINLRTSPYKKVKDRYALLAEYVFKSLSDKTPFPKYSAEEAEKSKEIYFNHTYRSEIEALNLTLNTTKIYSSIVDFAREVGIRINRIKWCRRYPTYEIDHYKLRRI